MKDFWHILTLFFLGSLAVLVVTHPTGFSKSAGTVFTGVNGLGTTLSGKGIKGGT